MFCLIRDSTKTVFHTYRQLWPMRRGSTRRTTSVPCLRSSTWCLVSSVHEGLISSIITSLLLSMSVNSDEHNRAKIDCSYSKEPKAHALGGYYNANFIRVSLNSQSKPSCPLIGHFLWSREHPIRTHSSTSPPVIPSQKCLCATSGDSFSTTKSKLSSC